ncbi:MAG TPA: hypothetical protein VJB41_01020 [Patescibacteria group bacterium]|nr:hypothetical protein [Patescibacteria group bacterium]
MEWKLIVLLAIAVVAVVFSIASIMKTVITEKKWGKEADDYFWGRNTQNYREGRSATLFVWVFAFVANIIFFFIVSIFFLILDEPPVVATISVLLVFSLATILVVSRTIWIGIKALGHDLKKIFQFLTK